MNPFYGEGSMERNDYAGESGGQSGSGGGYGGANERYGVLNRGVPGLGGYPGGNGYYGGFYRSGYPPVHLPPAKPYPPDPYLDQFPLPEALRAGTLFRWLYDPYENPYDHPCETDGY